MSVLLNSGGGIGGGGSDDLLLLQGGVMLPQQAWKICGLVAVSYKKRMTWKSFAAISLDQKKI